MNAVKQLRLASERDIPVVIRYRKGGPQLRQTPPVRVLAVSASTALLDYGARHSEPFPIPCSGITMIHPQIEEETWCP